MAGPLPTDLKHCALHNRDFSSWGECPVCLQPNAHLRTVTLNCARGCGRSIEMRIVQGEKRSPWTCITCEVYGTTKPPDRRDITIVYGEPFATPSARKQRAMEIVNKAFGTVRDDEEHQDFEGEEPTNARAQQFNREWHEAQHSQDKERIQALEHEVEKQRRQLVDLGNSYLQLSANYLAVLSERGLLRAQVERMAKDKQPTLRSERRVLVDIED